MHADRSRQSIRAVADPVAERGPRVLPLISLRRAVDGLRCFMVEHRAPGYQA